MYTARKMPSEFDQADQASKALIANLVRQIPAPKQSLTLPATDSWYANPARKGSLYFLREGMLAYRREGRLLFSFNDGDLVGVENVFCPSGSVLSSDFAVVVDEYPAEEFFSKIHQSDAFVKSWNEYLAQQFKLFSIMLASLVNEQEGFVPDVRFHMAGDTIIEQGSVGHEIYTLVEGVAEIFVDGNKIGEVLPDEVFGAMGGLTGTPYTGSVVAAVDCMVVVLKQAEFKHMLLTRPSSVIKLAEDMARTLNSLGAELLISNELKL